SLALILSFSTSSFAQVHLLQATDTQKKIEQEEAERQQQISEFQKAGDEIKEATALINLADFYYKKASYPRAEPLLQRALEIREKALGPEHPDVATCLNSLAAVYRDRGDRGDYDRAERLFQRALAIREKILSLEDSAIAET